MKLPSSADSFMRVLFLFLYFFICVLVSTEGVPINFDFKRKKDTLSIGANLLIKIEEKKYKLTIRQQKNILTLRQTCNK